MLGQSYLSYIANDKIIFGIYTGELTGTGYAYLAEALGITYFGN